MKDRSIQAIIIIVVLIFGVIPVASENASSNETVVIGILHSETFTYAEMMRNSFELALKKINESGGINGKTLKLVYEDDQGKPDVGEKSVKRMKNRHNAVMLVGGYSSTNTLHMARKADRLDLPFLVCTAADDRITQKDLKNIFRLNPPAKEYTQGLEQFLIQKVKPASMSIIYENSPYGTSSAMRMMSFCRNHDINISKIIPYYREKAGNDYFNRILAPLESFSPDIIYLVSYFKDGVRLVKFLKNMKVNSLLCGGAGGFTHPDFHKSAGEAANNFITATLWHHRTGNEMAERYLNEYVNRYLKEPDYHGAEAYTGLLVAADALKRAKNYTDQGIRDALGKTNLSTPMGRVSFYNYDRMQRQNSYPTFVMQFQDGTLQCIWPESASSVRFTPQ